MAKRTRAEAALFRLQSAYPEVKFRLDYYMGRYKVMLLNDDGGDDCKLGDSTTISELESAIQLACDLHYKAGVK